MFKNRKRLFVFLIVILLLVLFYQAIFYKTSHEYKNATLPNFALNKETNKAIYAESPKQIAQKLLAGEEFFKGYIKVSALSHDKAEIIMRNDITGDDSRIAVEYYIVADRSQDGWKISQYKLHWKCRGLIFPRFWTTSTCI